MENMIERLAKYDALPEKYRIEAYRKLLRETEFRILSISGVAPAEAAAWQPDEAKRQQAEAYMRDRALLLDRLSALRSPAAE